MSAADYIRRDRDELDATVGDLRNLISALRLVGWHLIQIDAEDGSELDELRNAVVGICSAMEERTSRGRRAKA